MFYPGENIVHRSRDDFGDLMIADSEHLRSLYFGTEKRQSSMLLKHPGTLVLEYTRVMMLSLFLLREPPKRILLFGMGGGSIPKFLLKLFPKCHIDVVELRSSVIKLAHAYFAVPDNNPRLKIIHRDARDFVHEASRRGEQYDLLLLDAFDEDGPSSLMTERDFWGYCKGLMTRDAITCVNLWNRKTDRFDYHLARLRVSFSGNVSHYAVGKKNSNVLIFCSQRPVNIKGIPALMARAKMWKAHYNIDFPTLLSNLYKQNVPAFKRWFR